MNSILKTLRSAFFSLGQKTVFFFVIMTVIITALYVLRGMYMVEVPRTGGTYTEALIGTPRYINPVLARSQTDKDISRLIYAPLLSDALEDDYVLGESLEVSEDDTEFVVRLKEDMVFHDGEPITSRDVAETIRRIQDPVVASPLRPQWLGVEVETPDERTVIFELETSFPQFEEILDIGILPAHIWSDITAEEFPFTTNNIQPIGSGPFSVQEVVRDENERIIRYDLSAFRDSIFDPFIDEVRLTIVQNSQELIDEFTSERIDGAAAISVDSIDEELLDNYTIRSYTLPRVFTLFYNRDAGTALSSLSLRRALDSIIDKKTLVQEVLGGYGQALDGPLPSTSPYAVLDESTSTAEERVSQARSILTDGNWSYSESDDVWTQTIGGKEQRSALTLVTSETDELVRIANRIRSSAALAGIDITVSFLPSDELIQNVVRPRSYEMLLFGYVTDIPANIYPFWHSTGRTDPGLNIAEYGNIVVDRELNALRDETDPETIAASYKNIVEQIAEDIPGTFLFSQDLLYVQRDNVRHLNSTNVLEYPEDRFNTIGTWYMKTERILPVFR